MKQLFLLLLWFLVACSPATSNVSILDNSKCGLPCWNNITPGKTSQNEALQVIQNLDRVDPKSIKALNEPWQIYDKTIWFTINRSSVLTQISTNGSIYFIDDRVVTLSLTRNLGLTFEELMQRTGEPDVIISIPSTESYPIIMAINSAKGVYFAFYAKSDMLQPATKVDILTSFDTAHYEDFLDAGMFSLGLSDAEGTKKIMYPWKGYGNINELYPPRFP